MLWKEQECVACFFCREIWLGLMASCVERNAIVRSMEQPKSLLKQCWLAGVILPGRRFCTWDQRNQREDIECVLIRYTRRYI